MNAGVNQMVQRCVIITRDENGYGLTVSGDNPVFVQSVKEGKQILRTLFIAYFCDKFVLHSASSFAARCKVFFIIIMIAVSVFVRSNPRASYEQVSLLIVVKVF